MPINKQILTKIREKSGNQVHVAESIEVLLNGIEESKQTKRILDGIMKKL